MYRRLPVEIITCEKELYDFMTYHPDTMINIWQLMKVSKMELQEFAPERFHLKDQAGTECVVEVIHRSNDMLLIYADGAYEGFPFPKKVTGRGLIVLQNQPMKGSMGENLLALRLDAFMQIENNGVEALAKTFQPLVGKVADHNLNEVAGFLGTLSRATVSNGSAVASLAKRLDKITPEVRMEFTEVALLLSARDIPRATEGPLPLQYQPTGVVASSVSVLSNDEIQSYSATPPTPMVQSSDGGAYPVAIKPEAAVGASASILQR